MLSCFFTAGLAILISCLPVSGLSLVFCVRKDILCNREKTRESLLECGDPTDLIELTLPSRDGRSEDAEDLLTRFTASAYVKMDGPVDLYINGGDAAATLMSEGARE